MKATAPAPVAKELKDELPALELPELYPPELKPPELKPLELEIEELKPGCLDHNVGKPCTACEHSRINIDDLASFMTSSTVKGR